MYDVIVIGAGVTGCFIARNLARYNLSVCVLEASNDVGNKTSSANSAIIHSGYDPLPGTNKAKFNVLGNKLYPSIAKELNVPFMQIGSLTVALYDEQLPTLKLLEERSKLNNVEVKLLSKEETLEIEPNLSPDVKGSLLAPTAGIIDPFLLCVRCMENAVDNGVTLKLSNTVQSIKKIEDHYEVVTNKNVYEGKVVINAAGNYADKIASMVEPISWSITSRKGEYYLLDHFEWMYVKHTIFPLPSEKGKGVLVSSTTSGNYLIGPSSEPIEGKEDVSCDMDTLNNIKNQALAMVPNIPVNTKTIRVFSGLRPTPSTHDFIIEYSKSDKNFINVAGIESPGLASAPAIGEYVVNELVKPLFKDIKENTSYNPNVKVKKRLFMYEGCSEEYVNENKDYSNVICTCESVTLGEIKDELSRSVPPISIKGLKRRCRAGMGKCQGGFCQPKIMLIMAEHYNCSPLDIPYDEEGSNILLTKVKEVD